MGPGFAELEGDSRSVDRYDRLPVPWAVDMDGDWHDPNPVVQGPWRSNNRADAAEYTEFDKNR